jgi:hypothetical protein
VLITINTLAANSVREETYNGRAFVVLNAMLLRADTAMNGILYSLDEVKASFNQLNELPAPLGHPTIAGEHVSASNNFARGEFDVGAFVRNVHMKDKEVHGEIYIDKEVASRTDRGKRLLSNIANKVKLGVSTGLNIARLIARNGVDELGQAFNNVGKGFMFDHLAILDGEEAAGKLAGTEIIYNSEQGNNSLFVVNHSGGQSGSNQEENLMEIKIDASDLSKAERVKLQSMTANELILAVNAEKPAVTLEEAKKVVIDQGLTVNAADSVVLTKDDHKALKVNAEKYLTAEKERVEKIKEGIIANSKFVDDDLKDMSESQLTKLSDSLVPANDFSVNAAFTTNSNGKEVAVDFS